MQVRMPKFAVWVTACCTLSMACAPSDEAFFSSPELGSEPGSAGGGPPKTPAPGTGGSDVGTTGGSAGALVNAGAPGSSGAAPQAGNGGGGSGEGQTACGNSLIEAGEACDDGARQNGDGCTDKCTINCADYDAEARLGPNGS